MLTVLHISRKEKKIFDPSSINPTTKKSKKNSISIISSNASLMDNQTKYNFSNIKLKEVSIKLERLRPEDVGKYLKPQSSNLSLSLDQVKTEPVDLMEVKEEPREEAVSVDELLSDQESEEENTPAPAEKVFECPNPHCPEERSSLNR